MSGWDVLLARLERWRVSTLSNGRRFRDALRAAVRAFRAEWTASTIALLPAGVSEPEDEGEPIVVRIRAWSIDSDRMFETNYAERRVKAAKVVWEKLRTSPRVKRAEYWHGESCLGTIGQ